MAIAKVPVWCFGGLFIAKKHIGNDAGNPICGTKSNSIADDIMKPNCKKCLQKISRANNAIKTSDNP